MALTVSVAELVNESKNPLLQARAGWPRVKLGEIAKVLNGYAFKSDLFTRDDGVPLIRIRDVGSSSSETRYKGEFDSRYLVNAGELLVGMDGDFNCSRWRGEPSLLNQRVCKITVHSEEYDDRFLDYLLPGYLKAINDATSSITVKHLSSRTIEEIPLPKPPLDEQIEIVEEFEKQFSRLDEAVANLKRVKANLKRYKGAVLKAAVEGRLVPTEAELAQAEGRAFETGSELLKRIHEMRRKGWKGKGKYKEPCRPNSAAATEAPEGWGTVSWDTVLESHDGAFKRGPFGSSLKKSIFVGKGYKVYEQYCPINDDCSFARYYITPAKFEEMRAFAVRAGDYLISCSGVTLGRITRVPPQFDEGVINQAILRVRLNPEVIDHGYFLQLFRSPHFQKLIFDQSTGSAIPNLKGVNDLKAIPIPLPPLDEQRRIVADVERRLSLIRGVEGQIDLALNRAEKLRRSVLAKAFAGVI